MIAKDLMYRFEQFASPQIAEKWDHVGLQLGNSFQPVTRVMTTLDVRPEVVKEAIEKHVDFIFAHHPMMFHAAENLDLSDPQNNMYAELIKHDIVVYGAHTNLDNVNGGMNDWLAHELNLTQTVPLLDGGIDPNSGELYGMGRVGILPKAMNTDDFAVYCKQVFNIKGLRLINGEPTKLINRVAILGGSGGEFYKQAVAMNADAYITGDVSYHVAHDMIAHNLVVVDPGHHIECVCVHQLHLLFDKWSTENNWQIQITESKVNTEPFTFV
ncbi:Nif3-like dinuclear metal center hexameric protein [Paucilactobacillus suebicus]|uniref:GTP cyclohydrolase 1 type 2 homolog n=1 Tax=Paucilactobacillus suebicus DSM 5007 = KCTC 3549 TaxID=1423807 RepID=A0A0R1W2L8_9LACO|nr:Nif3-like dinuclear metal center hexameric protein [Paucilactobacillus suebicus]KRM12096.1 hypothetical protein FD16_GL000308 [Paucilactobacillus suebicus DSM 5007 = KCTC 3549]